MHLHLTTLIAQADDSADVRNMCDHRLLAVSTAGEYIER